MPASPAWSRTVLPTRPLPGRCATAAEPARLPRRAERTSVRYTGRMSAGSRGQPARTFVCRACGWSCPKWQGRCGQCGEWNALAEEAVRPGGAGRPGPRPRALSLGEVGTRHAPRRSSGMAETDRVLGGGLVEGSLILLGGDPGIGKSTLALQLGHAVGASEAPALYCAGEESPGQLALRADRLGCLDDRVVVVGGRDRRQRLRGGDRHPAPAARGGGLGPDAARP
ncbi:MAG TPA: hypothetical protein DCX12_02645 [Chloroflexi bacterium]|nr:hypothetical protein [Chloroflexota bacterium]